MIKISNLSKKYSNGIWGISDFTFHINNGEIVCIAGPNGSGKTTVINCILDIITITEGSISCNGEKNNTLECKKKMAYVADDVLLIESLTGKEYIDFVGCMYELEDKSKCEALIELFNMNDCLNRTISTYSHGMKKKLQIISAFMLDVSIIILDEPNRGLDIESIISLKRLMKKFVETEKTILLSTHDLILAENICDTVCIIANGKKKAEGTVNYLIKEYNSANLEEVFMKSSLLTERSKKIEEIIRDF